MNYYIFIPNQLMTNPLAMGFNENLIPRASRERRVRSFSFDETKNKEGRRDTKKIDKQPLKSNKNLKNIKKQNTKENKPEPLIYCVKDDSKSDIYYSKEKPLPKGKKLYMRCLDRNCGGE